MGFFDWVRRALGKPTARDAYAGTYGTGAPGGFAGASINRLTDSLSTWSGGINADLDGSLVILRARARQMAANNEYGRRFLNLVATNIVGRTGPKLQVRAYKDQRDPNKPTVLDKSANDAVEIHYARWSAKADIAGRMTLPHLLRVVAKAVARDGEALVRFVRRRDLPYGLAVQVLEADRLDETLNIDTGSLTIRQGVEIDSTGRAVALYIKSRHPGERAGQGGGNKVERVLVADILHVFLPERAEQVRGYTWFHAILVRAEQLRGYNDAAVVAARIGASKIAALERAEEAPDLTASMADGTTSAGFSMNVEAGEMFELPPGYKLSSWNPEYPHANFDSFVKTAMRGIASGLDVATHNLSGDMTDVNYSSARIAELSEREQWMVLQDWFIAAVVEPIYQEWLGIAMLRGDITFDISGKALPVDKLQKFSAASRFQGRRWRWVDPAKEIAAAKEGVALGVTSRTRIAAEQGDDIEDVLDELAQESEFMEEAGLLPQEVAPAVEPDADEKQKSDRERAAHMLAEISALRSDLLTLHREFATREPAPSSPAQINVSTPVTVAMDREQVADTLGQIADHVAGQSRQLMEQLREDIQAMPIVIPAPQVRVDAPVINVAAPEVSVQVEAVMPEQSDVRIVSMPGRRTVTRVETDESGNIFSTEQLEKDI